MFLLRLAALLQVAFLPGYLLLRQTGLLGSSRLETALRAFAVSLTLTWVLVFALTVTGLYHPAALWVVLAAECAWFVHLRRGGKRSPGDLLGDAAERLRGTPWHFQLALAAALFAVAVFAAYVLQNRDAIFSEWDSVVSWNRWAADWADGRLPRKAYHYPQLVPASWSFSYVLTQDRTVQSFLRMLQALYPLGIALTLLDLGLRRRSTRLLLAVPLFAVVLHRQFPPEAMSNGCVDVPVAFFALLAVTTAFYSDERTERTWWLSLLVACGAALTKQAGLWVLAFVWISALLDVRRGRFALRSAALVGALVGSWYVMKEAQIRLGYDVSEVTGVTVSVHFGRGAAERLERALQLVQSMGGGGAAGIVVALAVLALLALSLRDARQRRIVLAIVLPYFVLWAFLYSYDTRNATLIVPFLALALVHGLPAPPDFVAARLRAVPAAVALLAVAGAAAWDEQGAQERQLAQARQMGDPGLNAALYRWFGENPIRGKVYTGYQYLGFLPGLHDRMVVKEGQLTLSDLDGAERDPQIAYVMNPPQWMTREAWTELESRIKNGRYRYAFDQRSMFGTFRLVQIRP